MIQFNEFLGTNFLMRRLQEHGATVMLTFSLHATSIVSALAITWMHRPPTENKYKSAPRGRYKRVPLDFMCGTFAYLTSLCHNFL